MQEVICPQCGGIGIVPDGKGGNKTCPTCGGARVVYEPYYD